MKILTEIAGAAENRIVYTHNGKIGVLRRPSICSLEEMRRELAGAAAGPVLSSAGSGTEPAAAEPLPADPAPPPRRRAPRREKEPDRTGSSAEEKGAAAREEKND